MKNSMLSISLLALSLGSNLYAEEEGEHMEVTAPNECCQTPLPGGLGMLTGWVGASGASSGSASLKDTALKAAMQKAAKQKSKKQEKKEEQKTQYDKATQAEGSALEAFINQLGAFFLQATDSGGVTYMKYKKGDEEFEFKDCVPSGPLNPNKLTCTEEKLELFTDPTDGVEKWAYTLSEVEPKYNPKHYDAHPNGYYPSVVDNQTFTIVFQTQAELVWQIRQIAAAK